VHEEPHEGCDGNIDELQAVAYAPQLICLFPPIVCRQSQVECRRHKEAQHDARIDHGAHRHLVFLGHSITDVASSGVDDNG